MDDGPIIIVSRGVAKHGRRDELIPLLRSVTEQEALEGDILLHTFVSERDDPHVIWELAVHRDVDARDSDWKRISPIEERMEGLWEQWPHPVYCEPLAAKVGDDVREAWDASRGDEPVIIVTRGVATHRRREELIPLLLSLIEQDGQQSGKLLHTLDYERDDPSVIWGLTVYRNVEEQKTHAGIAAPNLSTRDGLWEQWPHPIYCDPIAVTISDGLRDVYGAH
jgi:hypothetical protein